MAFPSAPPHSKELTLSESKSASHGRHVRLLSRIDEGTRAESVACEAALPSLEGRARNIQVWKEFPKQNQAIKFANSCRYSVGVFSFESAKFGTAGQRHFVVSALHTFVHRYLDLLEEKAATHFYEVIAEGTVCRLYFDIEYQKQSNPLVDGIELLEIFIQFVCFCLYNLFDIHCDRQQILDLDSSRENKFSRHLIFHFADAVFQNNREVGKFVDFICSELLALKSLSSMQYLDPTHTSVSKLASWKCGVNCPAKESLLKLFVKNDKGSEVLICDEGVYSKNRNFRLYMSSKLGKDINLKLANENKFLTKQIDSGPHSARCKHINILFDSLISHTPFDNNLRILSFNHPSFPLESDQSILPLCKLSNTEIASTESGDSSPFPVLDSFIQSVITRDGVQGRIRRVTYFSEGRAVMFDIAGYRYCENIRRHHRSNNIMLIANLERMTYYQKCYDPECKRVQFKSNEMPIPIGIFPEDTEANEHFDTEINIDTITDFSDDISDSEWMQIAEELETSAVYAMEP